MSGNHSIFGFLERNYGIQYLQCMTDTTPNAFTCLLPTPPHTPSENSQLLVSLELAHIVELWNLCKYSLFLWGSVPENSIKKSNLYGEKSEEIFLCKLNEMILWNNCIEIAFHWPCWPWWRRSVLTFCGPRDWVLYAKMITWPFKWRVMRAGGKK